MAATRNFRAKSSDTRQATSTLSLRTSLKARLYLQRLLPPNWARYFDAVAAGSAFGLAIKCPVCGERPPSTPLMRRSSGRRWRWLAAHMAGHK